MLPILVLYRFGFYFIFYLLEVDFDFDAPVFSVGRRHTWGTHISDPVLVYSFGFYPLALRPLGLHLPLRLHRNCILKQ